MSLSCSCGSGDYEWYYQAENDYREMPKQKRRKRCAGGCNRLINGGDLCLPLWRTREPRTDIEENIYGDEVPIATWYLCEECADLYFSITELGYCITMEIDINMRELAKQAGGR